MFNADQKSSARRPDLYPCCVMGVESGIFSFPLLASTILGVDVAMCADFQTNLGSCFLLDVPGVEFVEVPRISEVVVYNLGKLMSSGWSMLNSSSGVLSLRPGEGLQCASSMGGVLYTKPTPAWLGLLSACCDPVGMCNFSCVSER